MGLFVVAIFSKLEVFQVVNENKYEGTKIYFKDDSLLESDTNNTYIGNTRDYIFYYHKIEKTTDVFPISEIKQITIKSKKMNYSFLDFKKVKDF